MGNHGKMTNMYEEIYLNFLKMASAENAKRARKPNFSPAETSLLLELAEQNLETVRDKFSNVITNQKKAAVWQLSAEKINAIGVARRTSGEVKDKWRMMVSAAKKDYSGVKRQQQKTGGGKPRCGDLSEHLYP